VRQVGEPIHANMRGAAFLAGAGLGRLDLADVPGLVPVTATYTPDRANTRIYDGLFDEFRRLYKATRPIYKRLNAHKTEDT
jgi:xylulokinase